MTNSKPLPIFVYGTLMLRSSHPMATMLAEAADYLGEARCQGRLYDLGHYPGLVLSSQLSDIVYGDLFRLKDAALLGRLDAYEGCAPGAAEPVEYVRRRVTVLHNEKPCEAWTYLYARDVGSLPRIASGRYPAR